MSEPTRVEARLADLAEAVAWPAAPDLRGPVRAGIVRARRRRLRLVLLAAALAIALLGGAAAAASIELRGAVVQKVPSLPSPSPGAGVGTGAGGQLDLGARYPTLAAAERAAGFQALVPAGLGEPDEVWYLPVPGVLTLVYHPRPGLPPTADHEVGALVMEARASVGGPSFGKLAGPDTRIQPVTVNGGQGFWISGAPHGFIFYESGRTDSFRLTGDVLIWNQAGLVVRIESGLDEAGARRVAGTVRRRPV